MDRRPQSARLYCHYFQVNKNCKKEDKCRFLHDATIDTCPNEDRCPIKVPHEVMAKRPETEKKRQRKQKVPKREDAAEEQVEVKPKPQTEVKSKTIIFSVTMGGWDDQDIIKDDKPQKTKQIERIATKPSEKTRIKGEKKLEVIKKEKEDTVVTKSKSKTESTDKKAVEIKQDKVNKKESQPSEKVQSKTQKTSTKEEEIEEVKQNFVKETPKTVVIKKELPAHVQQFIDKYYPKSEEARNFISNFHFLQEDMNHFLPIFENLFPKMELDLMFIVDCTGSMSSWIEAVKLEISGIVAAIKNQHQGSIIRVSFVGYRDYGDSERYCIYNFSDNLESFQEFVGRVSAFGGDDAAEDVAGGFKHANLQNWKSKAKYAVLLADAPAHGKMYHGDSAAFYDRYPAGDPDGVDLKKEFKNLVNKGVKLYAVEIMKSTNMMFDIFKQYNKEVNGQDLDITKLGHSTQGFGQFISQTASQTLSQSYTKESKDDPQGAFYKALKICEGMTTAKSVNFLDRYNFNDQTKQNESESKTKKDIKEVKVTLQPSKNFYINTSQNLKAVCHTYFIVQDKGVPINWRKPLVQNSSIKTTVKINSTAFAEGAMRYAFYAQDTLLNQDLVAKLNKKQNKSDAELDKEDMVKDLESQFICQHIVNSFNDRVSEHVQTTANLKNFVHCFIYEIQDPKHPYKYYSAENYIEGEYVKFNNNAGWTNLRFDEPGLLSQALSHFSYQITEGYLMIVDLQGVGGLLTDPQIHCLDQHRFGAGNLGYQGMFKFFLSHSCNKYCQNLNLVHPKIKEIPKGLKFFDNQLVKPTDPKKVVFCMCDLCKVPFQTNAGFLYTKREQCFEKYCPPCDQKRQSTLKSAKCLTCNSTFKSSTYWFLMKRTDFPELCGPCRKLRRERMRADLK